mmetsp:Transcript_8289/g.25858  ORF Transcript_8289/g.25858 Transcript_8289/m.25858 type:complete len:406 (+) Transcript_8289:1105-2322(+)
MDPAVEDAHGAAARGSAKQPRRHGPAAAPLLHRDQPQHVPARQPGVRGRERRHDRHRAAGGRPVHRVRDLGRARRRARRPARHRPPDQGARRHPRGRGERLHDEPVPRHPAPRGALLRRPGVHPRAHPPRRLRRRARRLQPQHRAHAEAAAAQDHCVLQGRRLRPRRVQVHRGLPRPRTRGRAPQQPVAPVAPHRRPRRARDDERCGGRGVAAAEGGGGRRVRQGAERRGQRHHPAVDGRQGAPEHGRLPRGGPENARAHLPEHGGALRLVEREPHGVLRGGHVDGGPQLPDVRRADARRRGLLPPKPRLRVRPEAATAARAGARGRGGGGEGDVHPRRDRHRGLADPAPGQRRRRRQPGDRPVRGAPRRRHALRHGEQPAAADQRRRRQRLQPRVEPALLLPVH